VRKKPNKFEFFERENLRAQLKDTKKERFESLFFAENNIHKA